jgi:hypothetical protein
MESKDVVRFLRLCSACNDLHTMDLALEILNGKRVWLQSKAIGVPVQLAPTAEGIKAGVVLNTNPRKGIPDASNN